MIVNPAHRRVDTTGPFRADIGVAVVGTATAAGAHLLPWYVSVAHPTTTVNGFGQASEPGFVASANHLQWMIAVATIGALMVIAARVTGRTDDAWRHAATVVAALAATGAAFSLLAVPDGMVQADGVWVAAAGAVTIAVGAVLLRRNAT